MKRQLALAWLASGLALTLIPFALVLKSRVSASNLKAPPAHELAHLGAAATVHSAGRGSPWMNLTDGHDILTAYTGDPALQQLLEQNLVQPLAMASGDFDEDGMPDLIIAYAGPSSGVLTLHRGNLDAMFPESPEAKQRKNQGEFTDAPFLSPARVFRLPEQPDFIGAGDFNADGHCDVILAARGGNSLYLMPGDGRGGLGSPVGIPLPGKVTAMVTGEINRRDGSSAVVVGVAGTDGAKVLVFEGSRGLASPEIIALPGEATALAVGHFDNVSESEVAAAVGHLLTIVRMGATTGGSPRVSKRLFPFRIQSLASGDFTGQECTGLALQSGDGEVRVLNRLSSSRTSSAELNEWSSELLSPLKVPGARGLVTARLSSFPVDTVVVVNATGRQLHLLTRGASTDINLDVEGEPTAVLPMRLNGDALSDLVVLRSGHARPSAVVTPAVMTFTVTNTGDNAGVNPVPGAGTGTLRQAIVDANANPGADVIGFAVGGGTPTINLAAPLPFLNDPVTINGKTGGATRVVLNGSGAGSGADGLTIFSSGNTTVQSLVIGGFAGAGINIRQGNGNFIQGNFIGTDAAGTAALANAGGGVLVSTGGNTIGGTTAASRNVISGNNSFGISVNGNLASNNFVQGNFIGTDSSGGVALGNNGIGVIISSLVSNNTVGGALAGASNVIAFNTTVGVDVFTGTGNAILSNSIFSNGGLGINLSDDGGTVTPNDVCDGDGGTNNLQNFPFLASASSAGGSTTIVGTLNSTPGTTFRIEFFSSPTCDGSGNGEGQTFIGFTIVATPAGGCDAPISVTFPATVPLGNVITATATDPSNNTSEFSQCVTVTPGAVCTITCPADLLAATPPNAVACGTVVNFSPTTSGVCGTVNCAPASGSLFAVGTTKVTCTTGAGPSCSFNVTVVDNTPPRVFCPASISTQAPPGQSSALVNYPNPTVTDNCAGASVACSPPSGTRFPVGSTVVTCTGTDASSNSATCAFNLIVIDAEAPVIKCPANVNAAPPPAQTSAVVNYPPPTVTDNSPGASVFCAPASGSSFPAGITTVTCTATDAAGNKASCSFIVSVGGPQLRVTIPGNKTAVEFAIVPPTRKPPKPKNNPCSLFTVENIGFAPLVLTLDSISRTGSDVDNKRITEPNDTRFFSLTIIRSDELPTLLDIGAVLTLQPGQSQIVCARFAALIPGLAGKATGLAASDVLPDILTSTIIFRQNAGANVAIPVLARVTTGVVLIDPANPRRPAVVTFTRSGNDITVSYAVFDSNLDVSRAKYEFLDATGQVVAGPFEIDLTEPLRSLNLVKGQSFSVEQRFTGASSNPQITGVRLTVFDGETSVVGSSSASSAATPISASSIQLIKKARGVTLYLPDVRLGPQLP